MSATLLEGYLRAASQVSRLAVGDPEASPNSTIYKIPRMASQLAHVDGAPFGTRGGISVVHNFPADGDYTFRMMLHSIPTGQLYGSTVRGEQIEVSVNGQRAAVIEINPRMSESDPNGMNLQTPPIAVKAGPQRVSAAFILRSEAPVDDLLAPVEQTLADTQIGSSIAVTTLPHLREFAVVGPSARDGRVGHAEPPPGVHVPAALAGRGAGVRVARHLDARHEGVSPPGHPRGPRRPDEVLPERARDRRLRDRHPHGAPGDPREPALHLPPRGSAGDGARRAGLQDQRPRSRVAAVVLHLGQRPGRGVDRGGDEGHPGDARRARAADAPHARRSARVGALDALRVAVAAAAGPRQDPPRRAALSAVRHDARRRDGPRNPAPLRPHCSRGPRRARAADAPTTRS